MLGIEGAWVSAAYALCLISTLICVVYGVFNWNRGGEEPVQPEDVSWAQEEKEVEETIEP